MSYNGSGTFNINTAGQPVVTGTVISSSVFNALTADLATGLSTAITKDGQTTITNNIPFNGYKITNLGAGTASTDAVRLGQLQAGTATAITVTGTDTYTGTMSPALASYTAGNTFSFVVPNTNTTGCTLNIDGQGAKAITRDGSTALIAGDLVAGSEVVVIYDGTRFQVLNSNSKTNWTVSNALTLSGGTANGVAYLNGSKALTTGSALTFDGTTLTGTSATSAANLVLNNTNGATQTYVNFTSGATVINAINRPSATNDFRFDANYGSIVWGIGSAGTASEQMRLTSTGLGIGTSSPAVKFQVRDTADYNFWVRKNGSTLQLAAATDANALTVPMAFSAGSYSWAVNNGTNALNLDSSGNLGIGTSSPATPLEVLKSQNAATRIRVNNQNSGASALAGLDFEAYGGNWNIDVPASTTFVNPLVFSFGSTERMRLDSSGNLGLGVTPSAWASTHKAIDIGVNANISGSTSLNLWNNSFWNGSNTVYKNTGYATLYAQSNAGQHQWYTAPSGTAGNAITFTQAMTLDASGNLLVGTTSAAEKLSMVNSGASSTGIQLSQTGSGGRDYRIASTGTGYGSAGNFIIYDATAGAERARIDSSGNLLLACTGLTSDAPNVDGSFYIQSSAGNMKVRRGADGHQYIQFYGTITSGPIGSISNVGNTSIAFNTTSDYRLKNVTGPIKNSGAYIDSLKPVEGTWKSNDAIFVGLIAHEVQEVSRTPVATGVKDGNETQSMNYSSPEMVANIIAELQSLRARVAQLESK